MSTLNPARRVISRRLSSPPAADKNDARSQDAGSNGPTDAALRRVCRLARDTYGIARLFDHQQKVAAAMLESSVPNILSQAGTAAGKTLPVLLAALENARKEHKPVVLYFSPLIALAHCTPTCSHNQRIQGTGMYPGMAGYTTIT
jgi:ATP-dependent helicase YprA (DUF1998 family)